MLRNVVLFEWIGLAKHKQAQHGLGFVFWFTVIIKWHAGLHPLYMMNLFLILLIRDSVDFGLMQSFGSNFFLCEQAFNLRSASASDIKYSHVYLTK